MLNAVCAMVCRIKQATQGYFHDYNRLDGHEGKTWIAPKSLIREEVSIICLSSTPKELYISNCHSYLCPHFLASTVFP